MENLLGLYYPLQGDTFVFGKARFYSMSSLKQKGNSLNSESFKDTFFDFFEKETSLGNDPFILIRNDIINTEFVLELLFVTEAVKKSHDSYVIKGEIEPPKISSNKDIVYFDMKADEKNFYNFLKNIPEKCLGAKVDLKGGKD